MFKKKLTPGSLTALALATAVAYTPVSNAAVAAYAQDFEGLDAGNEFALGLVGGEGFVNFTDVWFGDVGTGSFLYSYGVFTAPNGGPGFSAIAGGEGGFYQGTQYMNIYSDYNNGDHGNGFNINTSTFKESTIGAGDLGSTWTLTFDYKSPSSCGIAEPLTCNLGVVDPNGDANEATASAFIKTLDSANGYATTNDIRFDTTTADPDGWASASISLDLTDAALEGQLIQFGFNTTATNYDDSGVYYDNICFDNAGGCPSPDNPSAVPVPAAVWLFGSGLLGLVGVARRKNS